MTQAQQKHKDDISKGYKLLATATQGSNEFWNIKNKIHKYEVSWGQAINLAQNAFISGKYAGVSEDDLVLQYYLSATAPYRPTKRATKDGISNIDSEINDEDLPQNET